MSEMKFLKCNDFHFFFNIKVIPPWHNLTVDWYKRLALCPSHVGKEKAYLVLSAVMWAVAEVMATVWWGHTSLLSVVMEAEPPSELLLLRSWISLKLDGAAPRLSDSVSKLHQFWEWHQFSMVLPRGLLLDALPVSSSCYISTDTEVSAWIQKKDAGKGQKKTKV